MAFHLASNRPGRSLRGSDLPDLELRPWLDTQETLHRYLQIIGKVRLAKSPMTNHWWQVALRVTSRGLTTGPMPAPKGCFSVDLDLLAHELFIRTSEGAQVQMALEPRPVAEFYRDFISSVRGLGIPIAINEIPQEIADDLTPFGQDTHHRSYDAAAVERWFHALVEAQLALERFRADFTGKCSPVHFFWGGADLAVTRFSGRAAPSRADEGPLVAESYAEEVFSTGFWHGTPELGGAAFYAYAVPEPQGFSTHARGLPDGAFYDRTLREFILPWAALRASTDPASMMQDFFQSTYRAAADLGEWDREVLERPLLAAPPQDSVPESPWHLSPSP